MRFYTCGVPVEPDGGGEAAPGPGSFEAGFSAVKAQVGRSNPDPDPDPDPNPNPNPNPTLTLTCLPYKAPALFLSGSCRRHYGEACHGHLRLTLAPRVSNTPPQLVLPRVARCTCRCVMEAEQPLIIDVRAECFVCPGMPSSECLRAVEAARRGGLRQDHER